MELSHVNVQMRWRWSSVLGWVSLFFAILPLALRVFVSGVLGIETSFHWDPLLLSCGAAFMGTGFAALLLRSLANAKCATSARVLPCSTHIFWAQASTIVGQASPVFAKSGREIRREDIIEAVVLPLGSVRLKLTKGR